MSRAVLKSLARIGVMPMPASTPPTATATADWPLTGRAAELDAIAEAMSRADARGVVLIGAAGVGKSRLAREAVALAAGRGWAIRAVAATSAAATIPFGAFAPLAPRNLIAADRFQLLRDLAAAIISGAGGRRLLLVVDDAHLLDDSSAALLHQLATATSAFALCTVTADASVPEPVAALWKDGLASRLQVTELLRADADRLLPAALGAPVEPETCSELWRLTEGNALFLREVVLAALEGGTLTKRDGSWRWTGRLPVTGRLTEIVQLRLGHLDAAERQVAETVALSEPVELELLRGTCTAPGLEHAETRRLITVSGLAGAARLAHPLYGEVLRAGMPALRAGRILRSLADTLEARDSQQPDDCLRITNWRLRAGQEPSAESLLTAAQRALAIFDNLLAERMASAAVAAGGGVAASLVLGKALAGLGRPADAERVLGSLDVTDGRESDVVSLAIARAGNLWAGLGRAELADHVFEAALGVVTAPELRDELNSARAALGGGRIKPLPAPGQSADSSLGRVIALAGLYLGAKPVTALDEVDALLADPQVVADIQPLAPPNGLVQSRCPPLYYSGRLSEAADLAVRGHDEAEAAGVGFTTGMWCYHLGYVSLLRGRVRSAIPVLVKGVGVLASHDPYLLRPNCLGVLAQACAILGRAAEGRRALAEIGDLPGQRASLSVAVQAEAWLEAMAGRRRHACAMLVDRARTDHAMGLTTVAMLLLHDAVRLGDTSCADYLAELAIDAEGDLLPLLATHAAARQARDAAALAEVSGRFEAVGALLCAAEAAADAAARYRRAGRENLAATVMRQAVRLARACEGARTPGLAGIPEPSKLSVREAEVARLAASGLTSKQVAGQLTVSVRTVENQLASVYAKLGIDGRAGLSDALAQLQAEDAAIRRVEA
jgi:DNA-binding CsgD family transcriptional regulator